MSGSLIRSFSRILLLACLLSAALNGCDSGTGPAVVADVEVTAPSSSLTVGDTLRLTATPKDASGGELRGRDIAWSSSRETVVRVSGEGLVTATGPGSATVTATVGIRSGSVVLSVAVMPLLSAGTEHTCRVSAEGMLYCWGFNRHGQLGSNSAGEVCSRAPCSTRPLLADGGLVFAALTAGDQYTCGLTPAGAAYCWGSNASGRLGTGSASAGGTPVASPVAGGLTFSSVSAGGKTNSRQREVHTCGVTPAGAAHCWGGNSYGQLGNGSTSGRSVPVPVDGARTFRSLTTGGEHTCALTDGGAAYCWGHNLHGELGAGTTESCTSARVPCSTIPVPVSGGLVFLSVSAGDGHTCGLVASGDAYCWGDATYNALGNAGYASRVATPLPVSGGLAFSSIAAGADHTCGITRSGAAYCWGRGSEGQLGQGSFSNSLAPTRVAGGLTFWRLSASGSHTCGIATSGAAYCWGWNVYGQLGDGSTMSTSTPVLVWNPN
ncbi:MAG: Ig-like domain-containing protein [Gemmatimonadetes bacterium]|nr:Ig-like domain-containing protein [Gemmatimonadota bacterium]